MTQEIRVLGISGSLRAGSYNTALLRAAQELVPAGISLEIAYDALRLPLYDEDVHAAGFPPEVNAFRKRIAAADAILIATPEYNYSVPGVLKNAIDWASRPPSQPFDGKPVAIIGASPGMLGTARAQYHLRQIGVFLNVHLLNRPEVFVAGANKKFDAQGKLTDEPTRKILGDMLSALGDWTRKLRS